MNLKLLLSKLKKSFVPRIVFKGFRTLAAKNADCAFDPKPNFCNLLINGANNKLTQALKILINNCNLVSDVCDGVTLSITATVCIPEV